MPSKLPDGKTMRDGQIFSARLNNVVNTEGEFDELVAKSLPELLDRATGQTKRFLRETNQWGDDIMHEKLRFHRLFRVADGKGLAVMGHPGAHDVLRAKKAGIFHYFFGVRLKVLEVGTVTGDLQLVLLEKTFEFLL